MVASAIQATGVARIDASQREKRFDETVLGYQGARPHGKVNMDALELLKSDHDKVRGLFNDFRSAAEQDDAARMGELCSEVFNELTVHTSIEEEIFYPAVREAGGEELNEQTDESWEEHHVVDVLMEEIRALDPGDAAFKAKMTVLMENVEHHAQEEEDEMFPQVRELMSNDDLQAMGQKLQEAKKRMELSSTSKEELQQQAREMDIEGRSSMTKEELSEAIQEQSDAV